MRCTNSISPLWGDSNRRVYLPLSGLGALYPAVQDKLPAGLRTRFLSALLIRYSVVSGMVPCGQRCATGILSTMSLESFGGTKRSSRGNERPRAAEMFTDAPLGVRESPAPDALIEARREVPAAVPESTASPLPKEESPGTAAPREVPSLSQSPSGLFAALGIAGVVTAAKGFGAAVKGYVYVLDKTSTFVAALLTRGAQRLWDSLARRVQRLFGSGGREHTESSDHGHAAHGHGAEHGKGGHH